MNKNKIGLAVGSFVGLLHFVWGLFIAFGAAQWLLDFIYRMHSLNNPFTVMPFDLLRTLGLVVFAFVMGYVFGYVFAGLWNKFNK
jgi:hypothetical protein